MSFNLGDQIIMDCARKGLEPIIKDAFVVNLPTHSPLYHWYEFSLRKYDSFHESLDSIDYKFVCGTNLLSKNMKIRKPTWNIRIGDLKYLKDFILVGVGTDDLQRIENRYTEKLWLKALSKEYVHSTRDDKTKVLLNSLGLKAINTGCVTLWQFTNDLCNAIPEGKSDEAIFTITDYKPDSELDSKMIKILLDKYNKVYCWLQGVLDERYLSQIGVKQEVEYINPSLQAFDAFLETHECDYIGTRLHAGIRAMQKRRRSIIIGVDNRAKDIRENYGINYIGRTDIDKLDKMIDSSFKTELSVNQDKIKDFLEQFI